MLYRYLRGIIHRQRIRCNINPFLTCGYCVSLKRDQGVSENKAVLYNFAECAAVLKKAQKYQEPVFTRFVRGFSDSP